jgi:hypothetical protein
MHNYICNIYHIITEKVIKIFFLPSLHQQVFTEGFTYARYNSRYQRVSCEQLR